jgi:hypothetical protein
MVSPSVMTVPTIANSALTATGTGLRPQAAGDEHRLRCDADPVEGVHRSGLRPLVRLEPGLLQQFSTCGRQSVLPVCAARDHLEGSPDGAPVDIDHEDAVVLVESNDDDGGVA